MVSVLGSVGPLELQKLACGLCRFLGSQHQAWPTSFCLNTVSFSILGNKILTFNHYFNWQFIFPCWSNSRTNLKRELWFQRNKLRKLWVKKTCPLLMCVSLLPHLPLFSNSTFNLGWFYLVSKAWLFLHGLISYPWAFSYILYGISS